jgi:hypothetical protein
VVKNGNSKALELSMIDDPADVNGLAGVADAGADGQCDVYWNRTKGTLAQSYHFTRIAITFDLNIKQCYACMKFVEHNYFTEKYLLKMLQCCNGTARSKNCKQLLEYQNLLLLRDIWWSKFQSIFKCSSFLQYPSVNWTSVAA